MGRSRFVPIPTQLLPRNVTRFVLLKWMKHPVPQRLVDVYTDDHGNLMCTTHTKLGREFTSYAKQIGYYRGFEDPW